MIISIENSEYEIGDIELFKRNDNCAEYTISQISNDLMPVVKNSIENGINYEYIEVLKEGGVHLDLNHCLFKGLCIIGKSVQLHVGWVN